MKVKIHKNMSISAQEAFKRNQIPLHDFFFLSQQTRNRRKLFQHKESQIGKTHSSYHDQ